jgi:hypothetical protein
MNASLGQIQIDEEDKIQVGINTERQIIAPGKYIESDTGGNQAKLGEI